MKKPFLFFGMPLLAVTVLAAVGCGPKRPDNLPQLYPTKITIKSEGKPLQHAIVRVYRLDNPVPYYLGGQADANGVAEIVAQTPTGIFKGAPDGELTVTVLFDVVVGTGNNATAKNRMTPQYRDEKMTPLKMSVSKSGPNTAEFDVELLPE